MTIKFEYKCDKCNNDYIEQRGNDEPNAYFTTCHSCHEGTYQEVAQTVLAPEPERVVGPAVVIEVTPDV